MIIRHVTMMIFINDIVVIALKAKYLSYLDTKMDTKGDKGGHYQKGYIYLLNVV